jgi:hypothetical protein
MTRNFFLQLLLIRVIRFFVPFVIKLEQQINTNITNGRMTRIFFLSLFFNRVIHFFVPFASTPQRPFGINPSLSSWKPLRAPHSPQGFHTLRQGFSPPTPAYLAASR